MHPGKRVETPCRILWPVIVQLNARFSESHVPPGRLRHGAAAGGGARRAGNLRREDGHVGAAPSVTSHMHSTCARAPFSVSSGRIGASRTPNETSREPRVLMSKTPVVSSCFCDECRSKLLCSKSAAAGLAAASGGRFRPALFARAGQLHPSGRPRAAAARGEAGFIVFEDHVQLQVSRSLRSWWSSARTTRQRCCARRTRGRGRWTARRA